MKRKKRTQRLLAMLLTLILCMGELSSTGLKVFAADGEIADTVSDTEDAMLSASWRIIKLGD